MKQERGFTLIELFTVIGIVGVLSYLGLTSLHVYRGDAAYAVAEDSVRSGITALEGGLSVPDAVLPNVAGYVQTSQGTLTNADAQKLLPGMMIPRKVKFEFDYDPSCNVGACEQAAIQVKHCFGRDYVRFVRYGDGTDVRLENVPGVGCN
jgi:prepilin-type N-terminal cleavage/methylation domain-containing protein